MEQTLFTAIKIEPNKTLLKIRDSIESSLKNERVKFYPHENWFLIIRHLGTIDTEFLPDINRILGKIINNTQPFSVKVDGLFVYPYLVKPDVLWFNFEQTPELMDLAGRIDKELTEYGVHEEFFAFYPHITFARIRNIKNKKTLENLAEKYSKINDKTQYKVNEILMIEQARDSKGTKYNIRNRFVLGQNL